MDNLVLCAGGAATVGTTRLWLQKLPDLVLSLVKSMEEAMQGICGKDSCKVEVPNALQMPQVRGMVETIAAGQAWNSRLVALALMQLQNMG